MQQSGTKVPSPYPKPERGLWIDGGKVPAGGLGKVFGVIRAVVPSCHGQKWKQAPQVPRGPTTRKWHRRPRPDPLVELSQLLQGRSFVKVVLVPPERGEHHLFWTAKVQSQSPIGPLSTKGLSILSSASVPATRVGSAVVCVCVVRPACCACVTVLLLCTLAG